MSAVDDRRQQRARGQAVLDALAVDVLPLPGVERAALFGSSGLRVHGKVFAFVGTEGGLIVKVLAARASALIADGMATPVRIGRNPAREWIEVPVPSSSDDTDHWRDLLDEAYRFVAELAAPT